MLLGTRHALRNLPHTHKNCTGKVFLNTRLNLAASQSETIIKTKREKNGCMCKTLRKIKRYRKYSVNLEFQKSLNQFKNGTQPHLPETNSTADNMSANPILTYRGTW